MSQNQETILTLSGALNGTLRGDLSCTGHSAPPARRGDGILPARPCLCPVPACRAIFAGPTAA